MYSLVIKNGLIIDGAGTEPVKLDIAIDGGEIANMAPEITTAAKTVIDATGRIVCPGFIDTQNHSDSYWQLFENPGLGSMTSQGFTTLVVGQCGASLAPLINPESLLPVRKWHDLDGTNINWKTFAELRGELNARGLGTNVVSFIGYETLRRSFTKDEARSLSGTEREAIRKLIEESFTQGAGGVSLGLSYSHEWSAPERDLDEVFRLCAEAGKPISVHLRSEGSHVLDSLHEVIHLAKQTGARLKISHFKIRGRRNWPQLDSALRIIEKAEKDGVSLTFDIYPYDTTWHVLYNFLPHWATNNGRQEMLQQLADPVQRRKIKDYLSDYNLGVRNLILASTNSHISSVGKSLNDIASGLELSVEEAVLYLLQHGGSEVLVFDHNLNPEEMDRLLNHPQSIIGTDGGGFPLADQPEFGQIQNKLVHPRCFGTTAKFLSRIIKTKQMSLSKGIKKLTSQPAEMLGMNGRGILKIGNVADVVIFDPEKIRDQATLENPFMQTEGIEHVFVSGHAVVAHGKLTDNRPGRLLSI